MLIFCFGFQFSNKKIFPHEYFLKLICFIFYENNQCMMLEVKSFKEKAKQFDYLSSI